MHKNTQDRTLLQGMESHEKEKQKDKKHTGKMIRKNSNLTGAYYSWLLDVVQKRLYK